MNPHLAIRYLLVATLGILSCAISPALAQLPRIRLDAIFPAGGQAGSVVSVTIRGELSDAATELVFSHPDIEAIQKQEPASEFRVARRKANQFEVRIGDRVPPGRYEVRAAGTSRTLGSPKLSWSTISNIAPSTATAIREAKPFQNTSWRISARTNTGRTA